VEEKSATSQHYNKPKRRQALLEIRRLIIEQGLSHTEIQLRLNIPSTTYFRYLDLLFEEEQMAISGNHYTRQRLLNETLVLNQRYLHIARKLIEIGDDKTVDAEQRITAYESAASYHRASHDMAFFAPSYLRTQGLLPNPANGDDPHLPLGQIRGDEEPDEHAKERFDAAGEYRKKNILKDPEVSEEAKEEIRQELEEQQVREENKAWEELVKRAKANNRTISPTPPEQWRAQYRRQKQQ
jgi:hypothetical protein